jgi:hypothetical protein
MTHCRVAQFVGRFCPGILSDLEYQYFKVFVDMQMAQVPDRSVKAIHDTFVQISAILGWRNMHGDCQSTGGKVRNI